MGESQLYPIRLPGFDMPSLPTIRLSTAKPAVDALDRLGVDADSILEGMGLSRAAVANSEIFVPAIVLYQFCEDAAKAAQDEHLLVHVGESVNTAHWPPLIEASKSAKTVGDLLKLFAGSAAAHSSATVQNLEVHGREAVFFGRRSFKPSIVPAQIDGFFVGLLVATLRRALGKNWRPEEVMVILSDPRVLPDVFHGIKAIRGDRMGYRIQFPTKWLTLPFDRPTFVRLSEEDARSAMPGPTAQDSVRQILKPHLCKNRLTTARAAGICGLKPHRLKRLLAREGKNMSALLDEMKREFAMEELAHSERSVSNIAAALGYSDPTSFTRSFMRWKSVSPQQYRRSKTS